MNKKISIVISVMALVVMVGMLVGVGNMTVETTRDLGVALTKSDTTIAKKGVDTEAEAAKALERANATAEAAYEMGGDTLIAYERTGYTQPLGESTVVWGNRSQDLAGIVAVEVVSMGALALVVVLIASRIIRRAMTHKE
ncbi:hypothetical protein IJG29_00210 [Candidatus Saccharibacteria bacterium]|nr:hypothetical protein [Candidatus Saccharibacteria bacterium]